MLSGSSEDTCRVTLLIMLRWMEEVIGPDPAVYLI